jgi:hypothetical protein
MDNSKKPLDLPRELRVKISGVYNMGRKLEIRNAKGFSSSTRARQHKNLVVGRDMSQPRRISAKTGQVIQASCGLDPKMTSY